MNIEATEYTREDGVAACKIPEGWVVRCFYGPSWFWDQNLQDWTICSQSGFKLSNLAMSKEQALSLLETVTSKRPSKKSASL